MEKTNKPQEKPKMNQHHLRSSRYSENFIPTQPGKKTPAQEGRLPDAQNPKRLKELH